MRRRECLRAMSLEKWGEGGEAERDNGEERR